jgi:hypothetical protein
VARSSICDRASELTIRAERPGVYRDQYAVFYAPTPAEEVNDDRHP